MLEQMSPWEYQEIRKVLGHGSGFDSPGVERAAAARCRALGEAFHARPARAGLVARSSSTSSGREHEELYQLAEALIELDEWLQTLAHPALPRRRARDRRQRRRHAGHAGRGARPARSRRVVYPELWDVRNELTGAVEGRTA